MARKLTNMDRIALMMLFKPGQGSTFYRMELLRQRKIFRGKATIYEFIYEAVDGKVLYRNSAISFGDRPRMGDRSENSETYVDGSASTRLMDVVPARDVFRNVSDRRMFRGWYTDYFDSRYTDRRRGRNGQMYWEKVDGTWTLTTHGHDLALQALTKLDSVRRDDPLFNFVPKHYKRAER